MWNAASAVAHELKSAFRVSIHRPGHTALVVAVLASGLACVMFMLVLMDGLVMRPLPFDRGGELLHLGLSEQTQPGEVRGVSGHDLLQWQVLLSGTAQLGAFYSTTINLSDIETPERFDGAMVTPGLLSVLGVEPVIGRTFTAADAMPGAPRTALISWSLWQSRYAGQAGIVGQQIRMNAEPATVIGVMPETFSFPHRETIWALDVPQNGIARSESSTYAVVARLPADSVARMNSLLDGWFEQASTESRDYFSQRAITHEPLSHMFVSAQTRRILGLMLGAVLMVLLIACANSANLLLTRNAGRQQELSVRVALGASGRRLAVHLLAHSLLLSLTAMVVALPLAMLGIRWLDAMFANSEEGFPVWMRLDLDWRVLMLALLAALLTALVSGAYPAWRVARDAIGQGIRRGGRNATGGAFAAGSRWLVAGELAMSCVLLISAGAMVVGVINFIHSDIGVKTDQRLTARMGLAGPEYAGEAQQAAFYQRLGDRIRNEPGVVDATVSSILPGLIGDDRAIVAEQDMGSSVAMKNTRFGAVDDHFFSTFGVSLRSGRFFDQRDTADGMPVAVVDSTFAGRLSPDGDVIGKRFVLDPDDASSPTTYTVIGVTAPLQLDDVDDPVAPSMLVPLRQQPIRYASLVVHTRDDALAFAPRLQSVVQELQPDTPIYWVRSYEQVIYEATVGEHVLARVFSVLGIVALVLAAAGLYGVIAFNVTQRTREIGIRRALGAPRRQLITSLLRSSLWQIVIGLLLGVGVGIPFARLLTSQIETLQVPLFAIGLATTLFMTLVALLASLLPARLALDVEPMRALHHE